MTSSSEFECGGIEDCSTIKRYVASGADEAELRERCQQNRLAASTDNRFSHMTTVQLERVCAIFFSGELEVEGVKNA